MLLDVELARLHARLLVGKERLKSRGLVEALRLHASLRPEALRLQRSREILQVGLLLNPLVRQRSLQRLLLVHSLRLEAVGFALHAGLLLVGEVGKRSLKSRLGAQLLHAQLRSKVLLPHREPCADIGLLSGLSSLLLTVELLLRRTKGLLIPRTSDVRKALLEVAFRFRFLDGLTRAAKSPSLRITSATCTTGDVCLTNSFTQLRSQRLLQVRRHIPGSGAGSSERLRSHALRRSLHLEGPQIGAIAGLGCWNSLC